LICLSNAQIDNQTGSLCCDAWLGEPVDEHGRLLKAPPGHRYEEVDALATDERGYRIYRIDRFRQISSIHG
jgi:hypothetical protein